MTDAQGWLPIETARDVCPEGGMYVLVYSKIIGRQIARVICIRGKLFANAGTYCGDAIEQWGVYLWQPLPQPPEGEQA